MDRYFVYMLASKKHWVLYVGITNNLYRRVWEHKEWIIEWFTKKYHVKKLVYYEETASIQAAIKREKQIKNWKRAWKINVIEETNPHWDDMYIL